MRYRFNKFEFDSDSLLLTNNGEAQAIRHSEAKVLALLLEQADSVLNKEDILSHAWQHTIVSEQVVFQNISHLRILFGKKAIKTFPKRGYQWQLSTEVISSEARDTTVNQYSANVINSSQQPGRSMPTKNRHFWPLVALACVLLITVSLINFQNEIEQEKTESVINLAYIPMTNLDDTTNTKNENIILEDNKDFDFTELSHLNTEVFEGAIEIEYPKLSKTHPYVLTGKIRTHKKKTYLDFMLKGLVSDWQGQLSGFSKQDVIEQLQLHLKQQVIYDLISKPQPAGLKLAKLSIAHQASPDDLIILRELSIIYFLTGELEKAMAMTDKLINLAQSENNPQQMGRALAYQSKILTKKKLYDLSSQKLKLAIEQFEQINDLKYQARAWYYQSWLDDQNENYPAIKTSLLKSAQLAFAAKNKLGEIDTLVHLAGKAHYYQNDGDKYFYLRQAESKMNTYQLPVYHFAKISYRYAIFAKTLSEKEPHLKQVLKLTVLTPEYWAAQSSRRQLMQHYLSQNRLVEAQALIDSISADNGNNSYLKTLMAQAKQQNNDMIGHAQRTFEQAQLAGDSSLSLDVALLLCNQKVNCDFYSQYINGNATAHWRNTNEFKRLAPTP